MELGIKGLCSLLAPWDITLPLVCRHPDYCEEEEEDVQCAHCARIRTVKRQ